MSKDRIRIELLGGLTIWRGEQKISSQESRSRNIWLLLSYLIVHHDRVVPRKELTKILWGDENSNGVKTLSYRARTVLNRLGEDSGRELLVQKEEGYIWNPEGESILDIEVFESLCRSGERCEDQRLSQLLKAIELYQGDFLPMHSSEPWVIPVSVYYQNLYIGAVQEALERLEQGERLKEAAELCRKAIRLVPYCEELHSHFLKDLLDSGQPGEVISAYERLSRELFDRFGVLPSEEAQTVYRTAVRMAAGSTLSIAMVMEKLREPQESAGALFCEFEFFQKIYYAIARGVARSGDAVHIGLLTVSGRGNETLSKRSLDRGMENLKDIVCMGLRRGDVVAQCSTSQYVILLPQANYPDSCMVCQRVIDSFRRRYPHAPIEITAVVQPLEPTL